MISFNDWEKKKKNYTLTKGSNGLPLFVLDNPLTQDDDDDREVEVITDLEIEIEIDEPLSKEKSVVQQVSDYITRHF